MSYAEAYHKFFTQKVVSFSKGYEVFEKAYEELKDELHLIRKEESKGLWTLVTITKGK